LQIRDNNACTMLLHRRMQAGPAPLRPSIPHATGSSLYETIAAKAAVSLCPRRRRRTRPRPAGRSTSGIIPGTVRFHDHRLLLARAPREDGLRHCDSPVTAE
jgi:hypothetical protein